MFIIDDISPKIIETTIWVSKSGKFRIRKFTLNNIGYTLILEVKLFLCFYKTIAEKHSKTSKNEIENIIKLQNIAISCEQ
jgi:hypothetical protein